MREMTLGVDLSDLVTRLVVVDESGRVVARGEVAAGVAELVARGTTPGLAVVLVGDDPASAVYVRNKTKAAGECGVRVFDHKLPATTSEADLLALIYQLGNDPQVDGITCYVSRARTGGCASSAARRSTRRPMSASSR